MWFQDRSIGKYVNDIILQYVKTTSRKEYLAGVVELVQEWCSCRCAGIRIMDEEGNIPYEAYRGFSEEFWQSENWLSVNQDQCVCIRVITGVRDWRDRPWITPVGSFRCDDIKELLSSTEDQEHRCYRGRCIEYGFKSIAIIPIYYQDRIIGAIHLADETEGKVPQAMVEFIESISPLIGEMTHRFNLEEELQRNYHIQTTINELQKLSYQGLNMEQFLGESLSLLLAIPWPAMEAKGAIFVADHETGDFTMLAHKGLADEVKKECARLTLGRCLCGQAALTGTIQYAGSLGENHELRYNGITPHGHYCVPIKSNTKTHGVICYYLREGSSRVKKVEDFLLVIAGTLASIIEHEEYLRAARQQLMEIIEFLPDATFVVDRDRKVIAWNRAIEEMTGVKKDKVFAGGEYAYAEPFYGYQRPALIDLIFTDHETIKNKYEHMERKGDKLIAETYIPQVYQGRGAYLWLTAAPLYDSKGEFAGAIETIRDISERKRMENQLQYLAYFDSLTNIPNRYSLERNLIQVVARAKSGGSSALLFIDLDNFKIVNDTLGHAAGDELLITLVSILKEQLRQEDLLFRFGGDEFAVLLDGASIDYAMTVAESLRRVVEARELCLVMSQVCFNLTISIGIVTVDGSLDFHKILSCADAALNAAKDSGRNRVVVLQPDEDITGNLTKTNKLISLIKNSLKENRFILFFQPVVSLGDGKVTHYEVLVRIKDETDQLIMPGVFIPVAERFGLMHQIDRWVVQSTLKILQEFSDMNVFINLSGVSLGDESLLEFIESHIMECDLDPHRIGFEITETAAVKDMMRVERWIRRIKGLGCSFALDDFGIGFSSFAYLRMLPVDYIKIDGTFIQEIDQNPTHRALVQAISAVANALGKKTIAEFVESEGVLMAVRELGISYGQGYHFGKPAPIILIGDVTLKNKIR